MLKLIAALCFLSILPAQVHALTPDQVFDNVKDSIVVVKTLDSQGKVKDQGSGVLISSGRVATSCHIVKGSASYQVGRGKQFITATLYAEDNQTAALDVVQRLRYLDQGKANKLFSLIDPIQTQHDQPRGDILDRYPIHRGELPGDYFERVIAKGEDPEKVKAFARRFGFESSERRRRLYSTPEPDMSGIPARLKEAGVSDDAIKTIMDEPQNWETRVSNVRDYNLAKTVLRSIPQKARAMTEQNVREWIPLADETTPRLLPLLEPRN